LREQIISGRLKPGDRLLEQQLARSFEVSQPTVREALKELEYEGFIRKISLKGSFVTQIDNEDLQKISEVRLVLEQLAVRDATSRLTARTQERLTEALQRFEVEVKNEDRMEIHRWDLAFHRAIWEQSENEYLQSALHRLVPSLLAFVLSRQTFAGFRDSIHQHRRILEGILSRDPVKAQRMFLESTGAFWLKHHGVQLSEGLICSSRLGEVNQ
jgi:DNA-binding GntR family transcriptional regulator